MLWKPARRISARQSYGSLPLEAEACAAQGMHFENFVLRSRAIPSVQDIQAAKELFERIEYPVLFHCKSGADRAGMMSTVLSSQPWSPWPHRQLPRGLEGFVPLPVKSLLRSWRDVQLPLVLGTPWEVEYHGASSMESMA